MKTEDYNLWLDQVLGETLGNKKTMFDFESWKRNHEQAYEMLVSSARCPSKTGHDAQKNIWRTIMKNRIAQLGTAAAVVLVTLAGLGILWHAGTAPAWAMEQTIAALREFNSLYFSGTQKNEDGEAERFEWWAKPNSNRTQSGDCRMTTDDGSDIVAIEHENKTYRFEAHRNVVIVEQGITCHLNPWLDGDFLQQIKQIAEYWEETYIHDEGTVRNYVRIKGKVGKFNVDGQSFWIDIDVENKLPFRGWVWNNMDFSGAPDLNVEEIVYDPELPEGIFEFAVPAGAKVIDKREEYAKIFNNPEYGMVIEGLNNNEACRRIVSEYWRSLIKENWERAQKLRGLPDEIWQEWKANYAENMPAAIIEISAPVEAEEYHYTAVAVKIRMADGQLKEGKLLVRFRELDGVKSCIIVGNYGPRELNAVK
jgi:hypothetical protein